MTAPIIALVADEELKAPIRQLAQKRDADLHWSLDLKGAIATVVALRPAVVLVDLRQPPDQWQPLIRALKSNAATRRMPVIGFARDLDDALHAMADAVVIDEVFDAHDSRSGGLLTTLEERVTMAARRTDQALAQALEMPCQQKMPALVYKGIVAFNNGDYYEAHEDLEHAWMAEPSPVRELYQGVLQVGIAYYHVQRQNYWGALKMFLRAFQWLEGLPARCHGIDIARLRSDARQVWDAMEALGPEHLGEFDQSLFQPVLYDVEYIPEA